MNLFALRAGLGSAPLPEQWDHPAWQDLTCPKAIHGHHLAPHFRDPIPGFCSRIWNCRGDLTLSLPFSVSPSLPPAWPSPNYSLGHSQRGHSDPTKPRPPPHKGDISRACALMRANFLSKHLKRGGAFSCHPLLGLISLSSWLWLGIQTGAFPSFNES